MNFKCFNFPYQIPNACYKSQKDLTKWKGYFKSFERQTTPLTSTDFNTEIFSEVAEKNDYRVSRFFCEHSFDSRPLRELLHCKITKFLNIHTVYHWTRLKWFTITSVLWINTYAKKSSKHFNKIGATSYLNKSSNSVDQRMLHWTQT